MSIKVIAVGNRMMGDDGIALYAAEYLSNMLVELGIEVIVGETDIDYCISLIEEKDELIIIDASCRGGELGSIFQMPLGEALDIASPNSWQHDRDIIRELKIRGFKVSGLLLCIETADIAFRWGLSSQLQQLLPELCGELYSLIIRYRGE